MKHGRIQIIGVGSPAGDDRLGWEVIARLERSLPGDIACDLLALDRPGTGLIEYLRSSDKCWLVDALWSPETPGQYRQPRLEQLKQLKEGAAGSHGFGLADTLLLAEQLGMLPRHLELHCLTIDAENLLGEQLSPAIDAGVDGLVQRLCRRLIDSVDRSV